MICMRYIVLIFFSQLTVRATDNGNPEKYTDQDIIVNIAQLQPPTFASNSYTTRVEDSRPVNAFVYSLVANKTGATVSGI